MDELRDLIERSFRRAAEFRERHGLPDGNETTFMGYPIVGNVGVPDGVCHQRKDGLYQLTSMEEVN